MFTSVESLIYVSEQQAPVAFTVSGTITSHSAHVLKRPQRRSRWRGATLNYRASRVVSSLHWMVFAL